MGFYSIALEQRKKESAALKSFLIYSFIASSVLHIGILTLVISKFIQKFSQAKDNPIEITIIEENVQPKIAQIQPIKTAKTKINSGGGGGSRGGGANNYKSSIPVTTAIKVTNPAITPVVKQPQPKTTHNFIFKQPRISTKPPLKTTPPTAETIPTEKTTSEPTRSIPTTETTPIQKTTPIEKFSEKLEPPTNTQPTPEQTVIPDDTKPSNFEALKSTTPVSSNFNTNSRNSLGGNNLQTPGNSLKNNFHQGSGNGVSHKTGNGTGNGIGNGVGNETGNGTGNGSGNVTGNGTGNSIGNGNGNGIGNTKKVETPVATTPKPPKEIGKKLNRADCMRCDIKYPDRARRLGIEGKAEIAIDTDADGNVTLVRLIRSSGDSELDEAAQQAAQEWKLKPIDGGRQGVRASVNFAIKGSQRHRQLQERKRERQKPATQKKPETESSTSNSQTTTPIVTPENETPTPAATNTPESNNDSETSN